VYVCKNGYMISSMTGYGKTSVDLPGKKINIEIKTLNSKSMDVAVKVPLSFREKEMEIRTMLSQRLERGKIDFFLSVDDNNESTGFQINRDLAKKYWLEIKGFIEEMGEAVPDNLLPVVLKFPDVFQSEKPIIDEASWELLRSGINDAVRLVNDSRRTEGSILEKDIRSRVMLILGFLDSIEPFEKNRLNTIRERLKAGFEQFMKNESSPIIPDGNRFEQELIFWLEKLDITEEKVRLRQHCDYFLETLNDPVSQGKKLGFISQEMGREINTIGSKANEADIQKLVVQMKDELEKIREQLGNIL
jgi:uncharacterized protein (TIGR00255 family)